MYPSVADREKARALLSAAFHFGERLPRPEIVDKETFEYDEERNALYLDFAGKHWWEIDYSTLYRHCRAIPLLGDAGFVYVVPAYALACLAFDHEETHDMCSCVLMNLNPVSEDGAFIDYVCQRLDQFTFDQKCALAYFVSIFVGGQDLIGSEARRALAYWRRYEKRP